MKTKDYLNDINHKLQVKKQEEDKTMCSTSNTRTDSMCRTDEASYGNNSTKYYKQSSVCARDVYKLMVYCCDTLDKSHGMTTRD